MDLADDRAVAAVVHVRSEQRHAESVRRGIGVPTGRGAGGGHLAQLRAAMLAVRRGHAARRRAAGHVHHHRSVAGVGVEVLRVGVAGASLEAARRDRRWLTGRANGELEGPDAEVEIASRRTLGVQRPGEQVGGGTGRRQCCAQNDQAKAQDESRCHSSFVGL